MYDPRENTFLIDGKEVGRLTSEGDGKLRIQITLDLIVSNEDQDHVRMMNYLAQAISLRVVPPPPVLALSVGTEDDDVEYLDDASRTLLEKWITVKGTIWDFHKNDEDEWPSALHGHNRNAPEKVDAVTGDIYDVNTRKKIGRVKEKALKVIQDELRASKDFSAKAETMLGKKGAV